MNNGPNGATPRHGGEPDDFDFEGRLNSTIYDYFVKSGNFECARALMKSEARLNPPLRAIDGDVNGTDEDSKDDMGSKRPSDLPPPSDPSPGSPFLLEWFSLFWDVWNAQRKKPSASTQAMSYVQHTQAQTRLRQEQQRQLLQTGMPNIMPGDYQMMRMQNGMPMPDNLRAKAMQNRGNAFAQATPQQLAHMKQQHQLMQQQMRRDPSDMDVNGQRARTPSSGDNAPSPSKRPRIEGVPFSAQQMMQNNRGPMQSMQGQPIMDPAMNPANQMLINSGIDPEALSATQYSTFSQQPQNVQAKSIQAMSQRLQGGGRPGQRPGMPGQGSPMVPPGYDLGAGVPEFMNNPAMMRGGVPPGTANNGNHALQDYQMQLMLLEQQNKKRLLMARQEQDTMRQPDGQQMPGGPGYAPGMSPSGSRSGPSPGPNDQMGKRSPKMGPGGLPGSPMRDGSMAQARGSPMSFNGQVPAEMYQVRGMENGIGPAGPNAMRMQPGQHPGQIAGGGFNPPQAQQQQQHAEAMRAQAARMPNGQQWQQAPQPGQAPVMQPNQGQQPAQMGTPQQRNAMPPPQAVPTGTGANGARPSSPAQGAPPTPQPANKANPKGKKDTKETRKRPKKASTASVTATPAGEQEAHTPTPATPIISQHPNSFAAGQKSEAPNPATIPQGPAPAAPAPGLALPQADVNMAPQFGALEGAEGQFNIGPFSGLDGGDVLDNFDFDSFLHDDGGFEFDASNFNMGGGDGVEAGAEGA
ncbi:MAG: hypothetical protein Q9191_003161 [Dirinaria sp. TL-2023a]